MFVCLSLSLFVETFDYIKYIFTKLWSNLKICKRESNWKRDQSASLSSLMPNTSNWPPNWQAFSTVCSLWTTGKSSLKITICKDSSCCQIKRPPIHTSFSILSPRSETTARSTSGQMWSTYASCSSTMSLGGTGSKLQTILLTAHPNKSEHTPKSTTRHWSSWKKKLTRQSPTSQVLSSTCGWTSTCPIRSSYSS